MVTCLTFFKRPITTLYILWITFGYISCCMPSGGGGLRPRRHRNEPPLVYKQYVPNTVELSDTASGNREGRIRPNSAREGDLLINTNKDIVFKDEERNGEDRKMTVRCHEKLDLLAMLVKSAWKRRIKLRVIEAWDTSGMHAFDSLHYEGRAIDITTSDRDRDKLGMLARLAVQAGFDWVYYETRSKVHVSCKSDIYHGRKRALKCFSEDSTVVLECGEVRKMSQIQVGDRILAMDSNGQPVFSPVIMFLDSQPARVSTEFIRIYFHESSSVKLTPFHLLYASLASLNTSVSISSYTPKFAESIRVGDRLLGVTRNKLTPVTVTGIERVLLNEGYFSPLTVEGNLIVNGVLASCYSSIDNDNLAHFTMAPIRLWHWLFASNFPLKDYGIHWYAQLLIQLATVLDSFGWRVFI